MARYREDWDLSTIPVPALAEDVPYDNLQEAAKMAKAARGPGRPKLPRCSKCGAAMKQVHDCAAMARRVETGKG
jgi:hypothetical protein